MVLFVGIMDKFMVKIKWKHDANEDVSSESESKTMIFDSSGENNSVNTGNAATILF